MKSFKNYSEGSAKNGGVEELTKKIVSAYAGKSGGEVWTEILKEAERSKRAGTLSNEELDAFYGQFAPLLDREQKKRLAEVVERLKKI